MGKPKLPQPTDRELGILRVLWGRGPCTVREVHDVLNAARPTGYTTVLKLLQIMTEKGLVTRDESNRSHVYRARRTEEQTERQLVGDLVRRVFGGSARRLVIQALSAEKATADELREIRELIDRLEGERRADS